MAGEWSPTLEVTLKIQEISDQVQVGEKDYIQLHLFQELDGEVTVRGLLHFTQAIQKICDQVKPQVEEMTGMIYREFKAVKYRAQEFGNNSLFKVHVGGEIGREDYIHLAVSQSDVLQGDVQKINLLNGVQQHKTDDDPLIPFS
ncbi:leukocyte cysteine proteinase inhibitor 1-like isoform 2-T2 [Lycodopsis pacificus]